MSNQDYNRGQDFDQENDQFQQDQTPNRGADDPRRRQSSGKPNMPNTQRDQSQGYDPQHTSDTGSQGQRMQGDVDDTDDSMRNRQPQRPDQWQASNTGQRRNDDDDDDYDQGQSGGQGNRQSDQDY